jgi:hypothetical protein
MSQHAHEPRSAYVRLREDTGCRCTISLMRPVRGGPRLVPNPRPAGLELPAAHCYQVRLLEADELHLCNGDQIEVASEEQVRE